MNLNEIQDLIKFVAKSGVTEVEIEQKDFKITIKSESKKSDSPIIVQAAAPVVPQMVAAPAQQATAPAQVSAPAAEAPASEDSKYITFKSPMIGTFYRSSGPDKEPFVSVGQSVSKGETVCIIEAMKLFNLFFLPLVVNLPLVLRPRIQCTL